MRESFTLRRKKIKLKKNSNKSVHITSLAISISKKNFFKPEMKKSISTSFLYQKVTG